MILCRNGVKNAVYRKTATPVLMRQANEMEG